MTDEFTQESLMRQAEDAQSAGNWNGALQAWACMIALYPGDPLGVLGLGTVFQNLGLPERAEAVIHAAMSRFPKHHLAPIQDGEAGDANEGILAGVRRWRAVMDRFPIRPEGYLKLANSLRQAGRLDDADVTLQAAAALLLERSVASGSEPEFKELADAFISAAFQRQAWAETIQRWEAVQHWHSPAPRVLLEIGNAYSKLKRLDEAEMMYQRVVSLDPLHLPAAIQYAQIAKDKKQLEVALQRWNSIVERFPDHAVGYAGVGLMLLDLHRFDEAEIRISAAMQRFAAPLTIVAHNQAACQIAIIYGRIADGKGDHDEAFRRWDALHKLVPAHPAVEHGYGAARLKRDVAALDSESRPQRPPSGSRRSESTPAGDPRALMLCFESLGMNCELGLVQRHFGAEPLGLLRWGVTDPDMLLKLLDAQFEGIDLRDNLEMSVTLGGEYFLRDRRYGTGMHTFIKQHENDDQQMLEKMSKRIKYLTDSIIGDLEDADKVFVYKSDEKLDRATRSRLASAVAQYNPRNSLMIVQVAEPGEVSGMAVQEENGLMVAHLDRPSKTAGIWDISFSSWLEICQSARARHAG